jgi:hypothetical protein
MWINRFWSLNLRYGKNLNFHHGNTLARRYYVMGRVLMYTDEEPFRLPPTDQPQVE